MFLTLQRSLSLAKCSYHCIAPRPERSQNKRQHSVSRVYVWMFVTVSLAGYTMEIIDVDCWKKWGSKLFEVLHLFPFTSSGLTCSVCHAIVPSGWPHVKNYYLFYKRAYKIGQDESNEILYSCHCFPSCISLKIYEIRENYCSS